MTYVVCVSIDVDSHPASASMMQQSQCIHRGETYPRQKLTTARWPSLFSLAFRVF